MPFFTMMAYFNVSIPQGTIKSMILCSRYLPGQLFQFHKVRLKVGAYAYNKSLELVSIPQGTIKSLPKMEGEMLDMNALQITNIQI